MLKIRFPFLILSRKNFEKEVAIQAMKTCEQVISEMGAEMHDVLLIQVTGLRRQLDRIERSSLDPAETKALIHQTQKELGSVMNTIQKISKQLLQTGMQEESFEYSVQTLCQAMESYQVLRIHPSFHGTARPLSALAETYLRRMIQELIHNSLRHSSAWHVWIKLLWREDALIIEVEDDGSGFSKLSKFISLLKSRYNTLRMRAESIGATIEYKQGKRGLLAVIRFPYEQ